MSSLLRRAGIACGIAAACAVAVRAPQAAKAPEGIVPPEIDAQTLLNADQRPNDWLMYHQSYQAYHHSALDQINTSNVKDLKVAWVHTPTAGKRGVQSFPLAIDGVVYYSTTNSQVWALDGATGKFVWKFEPKIDEERAQT